MIVLCRLQLLLIVALSAPSAIRAKHDILTILHFRLPLPIIVSKPTEVKSTFLMKTIGKSYPLFDAGIRGTERLSLPDWSSPGVDRSADKTIRNVTGAVGSKTTLLIKKPPSPTAESLECRTGQYSAAGIASTRGRFLAGMISPC